MAIGKWAETWKSSKDSFKDITDEKKPDAKKFVGILSKHKTSVAKSLKESDSDHKSYRQALIDYDNGKIKEDKVQAALNKFGLTVKKALGQIAEYNKTLNSKINGFKEKELKTIYYRGLKVMTRQLDVISNELELSQQELFGKFNLIREKKRREEAKLEKMTADEMVKLSTDPMLKKSILTGVAKMRAFLKECKARAQKDHQDPPTAAIEFYNKGIQKAARDLTQGMGNVEKRLGLKPPRDVANAVKDGVDRNSGQYSLKADTVLRAYATELKQLSTAAKTIEKWVKDNLR